MPAEGGTLAPLSSCHGKSLFSGTRLKAQTVGWINSLSSTLVKTFLKSHSVLADLTQPRHYLHCCRWAEAPGALQPDCCASSGAYRQLCSKLGATLEPPRAAAALGTAYTCSSAVGQPPETGLLRGNSRVVQIWTCIWSKDFTMLHKMDITIDLVILLISFCMYFNAIYFFSFQFTSPTLQAAQGELLPGVFPK